MSNGWLSLSRRSFLLSTDGFINCQTKVKFGYVVFTEAETAERLFRQGGVVVRRASGERIQVQHLATGSVFLWSFNNIPFYGRSASRGWMDCLHSSTAVNFYASISWSDFCVRAHAGSIEYLNPASWLSFSIFISSKLVAAKPSGRLFWYARSNLTCIFTSLSIKFSYLSTTIYEKDKFPLNQISWNWAEFPGVAELVSSAKSKVLRTCDPCNVCNNVLLYLANFISLEMED